ncbi:ABC transporter substrate-binding protein [Aestuariivirga litoralis]|uniref:ABC transporter substrate-binding protein n=1 Tax=Aestuariivirga litoralis TaxID=2650924 RepID=UPI0018C796CD|nr:sugar ABC transporter substrate-binding protein [Aestuariivirga litoralis]MBG1232371.1 sugar ABC transporter substrate-binding protein [Aestuariivirga litoralis]
MRKFALSMAFGVAALALSTASVLADTTVQLVEVITSPQRTEFLKGQLAEFEKANPGIHVDVVSLPWGEAFEKFLSMVQAGQIPDMVEMPERWMGLYANNGQLEALGPYMDKWDEFKTLGDRAKQLGSTVKDTQFMIPYGYYINAMFWNKKMFKEAGIDGAPKTMDEFAADAKQIAEKLPGKYGYCLRGGPGAFGSIQQFMDNMAGKSGYFNADGTSIFNEEGAVKGLQMLADIYQKGWAPKDSVSWGFNELVTGFYTGTCAMLNQDPDALIGIAEKMNADDFAVAPWPVGPSGKAYPALGYAGWAMMSASKHKDETWKVMSFLLDNKQNLGWAKTVGTLPIHNGAESDDYFKTEQFAGWFTELKDASKYELTTPPTYLENLGVFYDSQVPKNFQAVLLGQKTAKEVADTWAKFLTDEQQKYMAAHK